MGQWLNIIKMPNESTDELLNRIPVPSKYTGACNSSNSRVTDPQIMAIVANKGTNLNRS